MSKVKQRQIAYDITYMWNLKKVMQMNSFTKEKQTRKQKTSMVTKGERQGRNKSGIWG